ncbi:MAG: disulfide bond formation protein B [Parachlamydiaceae bacterium]
MVRLQHYLNAIVVLIISSVILSAFGVQIFLGEMPCPLCYLQRAGMIGVAFSLCLNLKFGIRPQHYGLALLFILFGGAVALRQIALHVCPEFPKFGEPVFGISLYTWSFFVFVCSILAIALMLLLYRKDQEEFTIEKWGYYTIGLIFFVSLANVVSTLGQCGFGSCE